MFCSLHDRDTQENRVTFVLNQVPGIASAISSLGSELLKAKFLLPGEEEAERLAHACVAYASDLDHAARLAEYISRGWFMFATPLLANAGTSRGLPISCFLNYVPDSREGLAEHYAENIWLSTVGGGIGAHWSDVRSKGSKTSSGSETTGVIPFLKAADSQVRAFRQGGTRQGAYAAYLDISHPEILEFIRVRSADGGDTNRKCFDTHIGVNITDDFMHAVEKDSDWYLTDPHTKEETGLVSARWLWGQLLKLRMTDRGEPYLFFLDTANAYSAYSSSEAIKGSNLCTEITLQTDDENTAVCCLSSVNVRKFDTWKGHPLFISDLVEMLDNVLEVFINEAPDSLWRAKNSAIAERSIGLGQMGVAAYLQHRGIPWGKDWAISRYIQRGAEDASYRLGKERGVPPLCKDLDRRNLHLTAIAPNATSSLMLGTSPGIEPFESNLYTVVQGPVMGVMRNPELEKLIRYRGLNEVSVWEDIRENKGSIQSLTYFTDDEKQRFRTFAETDQRELVRAASRRQLFIDQAQSFNVSFMADADPKYVNEVHLMAHKGVPDGLPLKSMYYVNTPTTDKVESTDIQARRSEAAQCAIDNPGTCSACEG